MTAEDRKGMKDVGCSNASQVSRKPLQCIDVATPLIKADFLSWQKSLAYSLRIFVDNFSLLSQIQRVLAAWFKILTNLLFAESKWHVRI